MTNEQIGVLMMSGTILFLLWKLKSKDPSVDLFVFILVLTCGIAGRIIAGKGMIELLIG